MKDSWRLVCGFATLAAVLLVASCGLIVEQKERENPLDENAPVAALAGFTAVTDSIDTAADTASITLSWELPAERAPALVYILRNENARPQSKEDGELVASATASELTFADDTGPLPGKVYHYAAWSVDADEEVYVGPVYADASTVPVAALASFTAVATAGDTVELSWALPTSDVPAGMIVRRKEDSAPSSITDGTAIPVVMSNLAYSDTVGANKTYHYGAWTFDAAELRYAGPSTSSTSTVVPAALEDFTATATAASSVSLTWNVPSTNAPTGIYLVRKVASTPADMTDGTALTVTLSSESYTDTLLEPDTVYWYAAWGLNGQVPGLSATDMANTTISTMTLSPVLDGYVYEYLGSTESSFVANYTPVSNAYMGGPSYGLIKFSSIPAQALQAGLSFYVSAGGPTLTFSPVAQNWDETVLFDTINASGFVNTVGEADKVTATGTNTVDLTTIVAAWASGTANYGIRISSLSSSTVSVGTQDNATASYRPTLQILCSEEFQD